MGHPAQGRLCGADDWIAAPKSFLTTERIPQRLKPIMFHVSSARLKPCPSTRVSLAKEVRVARRIVRSFGTRIFLWLIG